MTKSLGRSSLAQKFPSHVSRARCPREEPAQMQTPKGRADPQSLPRASLSAGFLCLRLFLPPAWQSRGCFKEKTFIWPRALEVPGAGTAPGSGLGWAESWECAVRHCLPSSCYTAYGAQSCGGAPTMPSSKPGSSRRPLLDPEWAKYSPSCTSEWGETPRDAEAE